MSKCSSMVAVGLLLDRSRHAIELPSWGGALGATLAALELGTCTETDLLDFAIQYGGCQDGALLLLFLKKLASDGLLSYCLHDAGVPIAELRGEFGATGYVDEGTVVSRDPGLFFRLSSQDLVISSAACTDEVVLHDRALALAFVSVLSEAEGVQICDLLKSEQWKAVTVSRSTRHAILSILTERGMLRSKQSPALAWEFHDLLFHTHSTRGHGPNSRLGATYRLAAQRQPEPAAKSIPWKRTVLLTSDASSFASRTFASVVQARTSRRVATHILDVKSLGCFLGMFARAQTPTSESTAPYETTRRLYPGAGACYELEVYALVAECKGLAGGLYYYNPFDHGLYRVSEPSACLDAMLKHAREATGVDARPRVLFLVSARMQRLSWKYERIAYALCLKDLGVLFHAMYLAATSMDLAPCALGCVDGGLFSEATATDPFVEPLVGEFMLA